MLKLILVKSIALPYFMSNNELAKIWPIMDYQEYQSIDHSVPYEYKLEKGDSALYYFGTLHTNSSENPIFSKVEQIIEDFRPDLVIVEGSAYLRNPETKKYALESLKTASRNEIIQSRGEMTFTIKIAYEKGIEVDSPDPTDEVIANFALKIGATKEEIFLANCCQMILQWIRIENGKPSLFQYLNDYISDIKESFKWDDFEFSFENFKNIHEKLLKKAINESDYDFYYKITAPIVFDGDWKNQSIVSKTTAIFSKARNQIIVTEIEKLRSKYKRIFVIMGSGHAVMQEPALRQIFNS